MAVKVASCNYLAKPYNYKMLYNLKILRVKIFEDFKDFVWP